MKKWVRLLLFVLFSLGLMVSLFTSNNFALSNLQGEAVVQSVTGQVMLLRAPWWSFWSWNPLQEGSELLPGDRIRVGSGGDLEITFYNGSQVRVMEKTTIIIGEASLETLERQHASSIMVKSGEVWVKVEKAVSKVLKFKVETPNAVAGVRGTSFIVSVNRRTSGVFVNEGLVEVLQKRLSTDVVQVQGGYEVKVVGNKKPDAVVPVNENRRKELQQWSEKVKQSLEKPQKNLEQAGTEERKENAAKTKEKKSEDKPEKKVDSPDESEKENPSSPGPDEDQGQGDDSNNGKDKK